MRKLISLTCYSIFWVLASSVFAQGGWTEKQKLWKPWFPSGHSYREMGISLSADGKGYQGIGRAGYNTVVPDWWEYDTTANQWNQKTQFPGEPRYDASGFSIDGLIYVGLGKGATGPLGDWWKYNPLDNDWSQLNDFPGMPRDKAGSFAVNGAGYIVGGESGNTYLNGVWKYNPLWDSWSYVASYPGGWPCRVISFVIGDKAYIGGGSCQTNYNAFYEFDPSGNSWQQKANLVNGPLGRTFSLNGKGYILNNSNIMTEYWPQDDTWHWSVSIPGNGVAAMTFSIGNKGYASVIYPLFPPNKFYEFDPLDTSPPPLGIHKSGTSYDFNLSPNPTTGQFTVQGAKGTIEVHDLFGRLVMSITDPSTGSGSARQIDMSHQPKGIYLVRVGEAVRKLILH